MREKINYLYKVFLSDSFVHEDGGRYRDVEGVDTTKHGNADMSIGNLAPLVCESCCFGTHHNSRRTTHIGVVIERGILKLGSQNLDSALLEKSDALVGRASHTRDAEDTANRGTNEVGVVEVGQRVADDDGIDAGSISRTKDSTEIARLLHALQNDHERLFR